MPHTPSAKKRLKQSEKRRMRNRIARKLIKTYSKRAIKAASEGNFAQAEADFRLAFAKLDKAGIRRVLHPNTADRRKSRLAREYALAQTKGRSAAAAG